jgi:deoxyribonuclease V
MALDRNSATGFAGIVIFSFPELEIVERVAAEAPLTFPYVPGLLAFREAPVLLKAFSKLKRRPDLIMIDGQGIAHPRGLGIASHMGLILKTPTIGCAKSRLYGWHREPSEKRGSFTRLVDEKGVVVGAAVRTRNHTRPVYVSIGHKVDLMTAIRLTLACGRGYRIPEPTRQADSYVEEIKRSSGILK